jgi:hypothetical protein
MDGSVVLSVAPVVCVTVVPVVPVDSVAVFLAVLLLATRAQLSLRLQEQPKVSQSHP